MASETADETISGPTGDLRAPSGDAELWLQVISVLPDGVLVTDAEGTAVMANDLMGSLAGLEDVVGHTCCELFGCTEGGAGRRPGCLTQLCLTHGRLPEILVEVPGKRPRHAVWLTAVRLEGSRPRVLFRARPSLSPNRWNAADLERPVASLAADEPALGPQLGILSLGRTRLDTPSGPVAEGWLDQRNGQLLKYLVCERHRVVQVEEIAEALWPGAQERGPSIVRHHIHGLRKELEPWRRKRSPSSFIVLVPPGGYALNGELVRVDADVFERLVSAGIALERERPDEAIEALERALTWYRGDFLAELPYAVWTLVERERLRDLALRALRALGRLLESTGDLDGAAGHLEHATAMQPFDTDLERELMSLALRTGRRSVALRRYTALRVRMLRQFGEEPDFELADLLRDKSD